MKKINLIGLAVVCAGLSSQVQASPKLISVMGSTATTYSLFALNTKKIPVGTSAASVQASLQNELNLSTTAPKLTACWVAGDLNKTAINCGNGAMQFGNADFYTYNNGSNIPAFPLSKAINPMILKALGANFFTPALGAQATPGQVVNIHFKQRVAQFGMLVDAGQAGAPSLSGVQFIVNRQTTPVQPLTGGVPSFVGVEDSSGFTDVTIIPSVDVGGVTGTNSWIADHFSFVSLAAF